MTKPSRSSSQGREARSGVSLKRVDSARAAAKPATPIRQIAASAPPATMTSASPSAIMRLASPIACAPVEQAVTTAWLGPLNPKRIETWPLTRLIRLAGMKNGLTRRGPRCSSSTAVSAMVLEPADAGADQDPGPLALPLVLRRPAGILDRLARRRDAVQDEGVVLAHVLGLEHLLGAGRRPRPRSAPGRRSWPAGRRPRTS